MRFHHRTFADTCRAVVSYCQHVHLLASPSHPTCAVRVHWLTQSVSSRAPALSPHGTEDMSIWYTCYQPMMYTRCVLSREKSEHHAVNTFTLRELCPLSGSATNEFVREIQDVERPGLSGDTDFFSIAEGISA